MIFLTVGSQMPFDRLVETVDNWAGKKDEIEIIAQIGNTKYKPKNFRKYFNTLKVEEYLSFIDDSDLIVSHAGMGTIITAFQYEKPIVVLPRRGALLETRNDHQLYTAKALAKKLNVVLETRDLELFLNRQQEFKKTYKCNAFAEKSLLDAISDFIQSNK